MNLPKLAITYYQFTLILIGLGILVGSYSLLTMPRSEDPKPNFPVFTVVVVYPGTGPEDMEELVVDPIEEAIEELEDIEKVETKIQDGLVIITIDSKFGIDVDDKLNEITREINAVRSDLPDGILSLDIDKFDPNSNVSIMQLAVYSGEASYARLLDIAEDLEYRLEQINGLSGVEIEAEQEEEIRVSLDMQKMANQNISVPQVVGILTSQNTNIPGGNLKSANRSFTIKTSGGFKNLDEIGSTVITSNSGQMVYLRDIADVAFAYEDMRWKGTYLGQQAVFVTLTQEASENVVELTDRVSSAVQEFSETLPPEVQLVTVFQQAEAVQARLSEFLVNLMQGIGLVGLIIFLFLGIRPAVIIMFVIPLSIMLAIAGLDSSGYALQQISIAALVIALGLLVDNGIVVVENIVRFRTLGFSLPQAAYKGTSEVGPAVISSTITTLLAFAPLALLSSGAGEFLRSLPVTVILVLVASLLLALTFTPIFSSRVLGKRTAHSGIIMPFIQRISRKAYIPSLKLALRRPLLFVVGALLFFFGAFALFPYVGISFFPTADKPLLLIEVEAPNGANIDETERAVLYIEEVLQQTPGIKDYASNVGHGNPTVYYNRVGKEYERTHGQVIVNFEEWNPADFYSTLNDLRQAFASYTDATISFTELKNGPPFEAPIEIKVIGDDLAVLRAIAFDVERVLAQSEGTLNVENPLAIAKTDLKVAVDRERASMYGVNILDTDIAVRAGLAGYSVGEVSLDNAEEYPLIVRLPVEEDTRISDLDKIYFATPQNQPVPLRQIAGLEFESTVNEIQHFDFQRSIAVTADVINPDATTTITEQIMAELEKLDVPEGYSLYIAGEYEAQQETFGDLGALLILAMVGIFAVLVLQFRSFKQPLIVFAAVPLAVTGSFIALFIIGWSFSFFAFVGFISLIGIVVNNSIILVDYTNQLMAEGLNKYEAVVKGAETRFIPIILTTTTTILGLLPLTLQATSLWSPLGWTIIGGMISSTFLTLIIVPILYQWFTNSKPAAEVILD
ncbi:MAG: efflux RND transporter permease subunit [Bacteroidota bacterium]